MNREQLFDRLLCVFFPRRCKYCGEVIKPEEVLCAKCRAGLPEIEKPVCMKCGKSKKDCSCRAKSSYYDSIVAPFYYTDAIVTAIDRMKFRNKSFLCKGYAEDMARCLDGFFERDSFDCICYIPFSKRDEIKREFNHSRLLAEHLSKITGIELSDALVRLYESDVQHNLPSRLRSGNVFAVYSVKDEEAVRGKRVLLVDDIKTTGATLNECAKMLKIYGALSVNCLTFAIALKKQDIDT